MAKTWPERATKTRQYDLLRPTVGQKEPPRLGNTICYRHTWARKSHQDSVVRFITAKRGPERGTETRQFDFLQPRVGQKEPPRFGNTICYGQKLTRKNHQDSAIRFITTKRGSERVAKIRRYDLIRPKSGHSKFGNTIYYGQELVRKTHRASRLLFITIKRKPKRVNEIRQYDLLESKISQKKS